MYLVPVFYADLHLLVAQKSKHASRPTHAHTHAHTLSSCDVPLHVLTVPGLERSKGEKRRGLHRRKLFGACASCRANSRGGKDAVNVATGRL